MSVVIAHIVSPLRTLRGTVMIGLRSTPEPSRNVQHGHSPYNVYMGPKSGGTLLGTLLGPYYKGILRVGGLH